MTSTIIFDLFGVVCEELGHTWITRYGLEEKRERLDREYFLPGDLGQMHEEEYWPGIAAIAGGTGTAIRDEWYARIGEVPGMFALIEKMRSLSHVMLCTNTPSWLFEEVDRQIGLRGRFDEIITSYEAGIVKPDSAIYRLCLERTGASPASTVFIDDREKNIRAAEEVGMHGIVFTTTDTLAEQLASRGFAKKTTS